MTYTAWSVVFGEQPSAAKWNILGSNDAHFYSFLGDNLAYQSWVPTFSNFSLGNGTVTAKYGKVGKTVDYRLEVVLGSSSSVSSSIRYTLPVTSTSIATSTPIGRGTIVDSGTAIIPCTVLPVSTTIAEVSSERADGVYLFLTGLSSSAPMVWTTGDGFYVSGSYEAA